MSCAVPHPVRGADGLAFAADLEVIGGHATETWARCRRCGAWFWLSTDVGGKYEYVGAVELDRDLAARAFVDHELAAVAAIVTTYDVPHGPVWTTASALVEIVVALTPGASDAARARALAGSVRWAAAAAIFVDQARLRGPAPPQPFAIDLQVPGYTFAEAHEVGASLVLVPHGRDAFLRLDAAGLVSVPLAGPARTLAARPGAVMFTVATAQGDALVVLDAAGTATQRPPPLARYTVTPLDGGWWLAVADAEPWVELWRPDGSPRAKFPRRAGANVPPPRRLGAGWLVSNLVDDDGAEQALSLFDEDLAMVAASSGVSGERVVAPVDHAMFWASQGGMQERWVRRGAELVRLDSFAVRASWLVGELLIADLLSGEVAARDPDGRIAWRWHRATTGATYGVATPDGVLFHDQARAHLLDREGTVLGEYAVDAPDVRVGAAGTVYMKSATRLWIVRERARELPVDLACKLVGTCADAGILAFADRYELVWRDGARTSFTAGRVLDGTLGGPFAIDDERLRVAAFSAPA